MKSPTAASGILSVMPPSWPNEERSSDRAQADLLNELHNTMKGIVRMWAESSKPRLHSLSKENWLAWRGDHSAPELVQLLKSNGAKAIEPHQQTLESGLAYAKSNASETVSYQGPGQAIACSGLLHLPLLIANVFSIALFTLLRLWGLKNMVQRD